MNYCFVNVIVVAAKQGSLQPFREYTHRLIQFYVNIYQQVNKIA